MAVLTVYGDLLFFTNFLMDFTLLFGVSRFGNFKTSFWRLLGAGVFAAAYGVLGVLPQYAVLSHFLVKILVSALIVKIAFWHSSIKMFFRAFLYFYLMSFAMAGAIMALSWLLQGEMWQGQGLSYTALALGFGVLLILFFSRFGMKYVRETLQRNTSVDEIEIVLGEKKIRLSALMDTGNELMDPVTKCPVLIVEAGALKPLLPLAFTDAFLQNPQKDGAEIMSDFLYTPIGKRLRLIPFSSIGKKNGLMLGVKPDYIVLPHRKIFVDSVVVCLYRGGLHTKDQCQCIMNPAVFNQQEDLGFSKRPMHLGETK